MQNYTILDFSEKIILLRLKKENKLIDEKVYELIEHGALHLMGMHHPE